MSLVDFGARGVPNVILTAALTSTGPWNAARFKNKSYDNLVKQYAAAFDLQSQRKISGEIERLLLDETPVVIPYFLDGLAATTKNVYGISPTAIPQLYLNRAFIGVRPPSGGNGLGSACERYQDTPSQLT